MISFPLGFLLSFLMILTHQLAAKCFIRRFRVLLFLHQLSIRNKLRPFCFFLGTVALHQLPVVGKDALSVSPRQNKVVGVKSRPHRTGNRKQQHTSSTTLVERYRGAVSKVAQDVEYSLHTQEMGREMERRVCRRPPASLCLSYPMPERPKSSTKTCTSTIE